MPLYSSSLRLVDAGFLKDALEEGRATKNAIQITKLEK